MGDKDVESDKNAKFGIDVGKARYLFLSRFIFVDHFVENSKWIAKLIR